MYKLHEATAFVARFLRRSATAITPSQERFDAANSPVLNSFWERDDVVTSFQGAPLHSTEGPKVLLLSLQDAASGTNLTRASLLCNPVSWC